MKLFVWVGCFGDGVAFALAEDVEQARDLIAKQYVADGMSSDEHARRSIEGEPDYVNAAPAGHYCWGRES